MNERARRLFSWGIAATLLLTVMSLAGCRQVVDDFATPEFDPADTPSGTATADAVTMTLSARHDVTQYSPRSFPLPGSLDEIAPPAPESWQTIAPESSVAFQNYDNLRVVDDGEALLDLGGFMQLLFKRDTVAQFTDPQLAADKFSQINVDTTNTPLLQRLVLSLHLLRGGFAGELLAGSAPVALTTPNAVVLVSGTTFFVAYDPDAGRTWVGNFGGGIDVGDAPAGAEMALADRQLVVIPPVDGRAVWTLPPELSYETVGRFIDAVGSPVAAAGILSGPNVSPVTDLGLNVYHGPGRDLERLGLMLRGSIVTVLRRAIGQDGDAYWQIVCPAVLGSPPRGCWVEADPQLAAATNMEGVEQPGGLALSEPAGDCVATTGQPRYPHAGAVTLRWQYTGTLQEGDYLGLRLGPRGQVLVHGTANPAIHQTAPGWWAYAIPASVLYQPGMDIYEWQVYRAAADGVVVAQSAVGCFQIEAPLPTATPTPMPDSDFDGWPDNVDFCPFQSAFPIPDRFRPGCPAPPTPWPIPTDTATFTPTPTNTATFTPTPTPTFTIIPTTPAPGPDSDEDGWPNQIDRCPKEPAGQAPDTSRPGCPLPTVPPVTPIDPTTPAPDPDSDEDGWPDQIDQCPREPAGQAPDPSRPGCPLPTATPVTPINPTLLYQGSLTPGPPTAP